MPKVAQCGFPVIGVIPPHHQLEITGPTLKVDIGFDPNYVWAPDVHPNLASKGVEALVDTGASQCFIDNALAARLNLPIVDKQRVSGSNGAHDVNMYVAYIHAPALGHTMTGRFGGVDLVAGGQRHNALLGRSFLRAFTLVYNGLTGIVELTKL